MVDHIFIPFSQMMPENHYAINGPRSWTRNFAEPAEPAAAPKSVFGLWNVDVRYVRKIVNSSKANIELPLLKFSCDSSVGSSPQRCFSSKGEKNMST